MACGPVSLTVLIVTFNQFIPITASVILYNEKIYLTQLVGIVFLILSMFLNLKTDKSSKQAFSPKWLLLTLAALLATGIASTIQKIYGKSNVGVEGADTTFLCLIYLSFISLRLPDSLLGSAWPTMYTQFNVPVSYAGIISMIISPSALLRPLPIRSAPGAKSTISCSPAT